MNKKLYNTINIFQECLLVFFMVGIIYLFFEVAWGTIKNPDGFKTFKNLLAMFIVGGSLGVIANRITPLIKNLPEKVQYIITTFIILFVEFWAGILINKLLGWGNWDYSEYPLNFLGQICLPFAFLWFLLSPLLLWISRIFRQQREIDTIDLFDFIGIDELGSMYRDLFLKWD
jgi:uncharacterized membrane protein